MKVDVDDETYEVHLCDDHADNTTLGKVTKKVREIKTRLQEAIQLAMDLGIKISIPKTDKMPSFDIVGGQTQPQENQTTAAATTTAAGKSNVIERPAKSIKLSEGVEVPRDNKIEMQEIEAKGGKISIPKKTEGAVGTTEIRIVNTRDDQLQKRFKSLKQAGEGGRQPPAGYLQDCMACQGSGINPVTKNDCIKCNGSGVRQ